MNVKEQSNETAKPTYEELESAVAEAAAIISSVILPRLRGLVLVEERAQRELESIKEYYSVEGSNPFVVSTLEQYEAVVSVEADSKNVVLDELERVAEGLALMAPKA